jgi:hypothetical protein
MEAPAVVGVHLIVASILAPAEAARLAWSRTRTTFLLSAVTGSCSLYRDAEALGARAVGGVGGGMLGFRRRNVVALATR